MSSDLSNLDSESIALLYLSGELSAEQKSEVEAILRRDLVLRGEVERVRSAQAAVDEVLSRADAARPLAISESAATRKVARAMAQWRVDWLARPASKPRRQFHWRSLVPTAIAASIVLCIGMLIWWSRVGSEIRGPSFVQNTGEPDSGNSGDDPDEPIADDAVATLLLGQPLLETPPDEEKLASAEHELSALRFLSESNEEDGASQ